MIKRYERYQDSRVEWIGEIPEGWEVKKLKYAAFINPPKDREIDSQSLDQVTFLPMERVGEKGEIDCEIKRPIKDVWTGFTFFRKYDVIIAKITPCFENGKGALLNKLEGDVGFGSTEFHVLRAKPGILPAFLFYTTKSEVFMKVGEAFMSGAAGQKRVPTDFVCEFPLSVPPLPEQTAIVSFLERKTADIDQLVANKERLIALYIEEKTAIINHAVTKGLDPKVLEKPSGIDWLGDIPDHWEVKKIKFLLKKAKGALKTGPFGSELKTSDMSKSGEYRVYTQRNVLDNDYSKGDDRIDHDKFESLKEFEVIPKDILITTRGTIGKCSLFPEGETRGVLHPCLIRIQIDDEKITSKYILNYINHSSFFWENVKLQSNSTIIDVIYGYTLKEIIIPLPPVTEQIAIVAHIEKECSRLDAIIDKFKKQIELFKEYRTTLISEAVTGKIDVRDEVVE